MNVQIFSTEQNNEAIENAKVVQTVTAKETSKKTVFSSNIIRSNEVANSAKCDMILHIMLLNSEAVHISLAKTLCEIADVKYKRFSDHVLDNAYRKNDKLSFFLNVDVLRSDSLLVANNASQIIDLFLLQSTQAQYKQYFAELFVFISEVSDQLMLDNALAINIELQHEQALLINAEFVAKKTVKTKSKKASKKK